MFKNYHKRKKKGQSTLEYAVLIIIIIGALLTIQVYIKRAIQGRLKSASDDIGDQFSPGNTNISVVTISNSKTKETFNAGVTNQQLVGDEITSVTTNWSITNNEIEFWGAKGAK